MLFILHALGQLSGLTTCLFQHVCRSQATNTFGVVAFLLFVGNLLRCSGKYIIAIRIRKSLYYIEYIEYIDQSFKTLYLQTHINHNNLITFPIPLWWALCNHNHIPHIDFAVLIKLNWPKDVLDVFINYANQKGKQH